MQIIHFLGKSVHIIITFTTILIYSDYWNFHFPFILSIFIGANYLGLFGVLPFVALGILAFSIVKYDKPPYPVKKFFISILAWLLLVCSVIIILIKEDAPVKEMVKSYLSLATIILFMLISLCFLIKNIIEIFKTKQLIN
jgi:peptidoglycan/LPS O-acetylase OafA/YrhL